MALPVWDGPMQTGCRSSREWAERGLLQVLASRSGIRIPSLDHRSNKSPLEPRVGRNMWIVDCPDCSGAELLWPDGWFMCASCWNNADDNRWRAVAIPANRAEIEQVLMVRPLPANRNWYPHETVQKLESENVEQGLPERYALLLVEEGG